MATLTPAALKSYIKPKIISGGYDWPTFEKQIQQESNWEHYRNDGSVKMSYTGSSAGVGQLNKTYYSEDVWRDPYKNIDAAANTAIANKNKFGTYRKALAAYNWGPGNVGGYTDKQGHIHPAWDGSRGWTCPVGLPQCRTEQRNHYLDVILGPEWKEPESTPGEPQMPDPISPSFNVGQGLLDLMQSYNDQPATDEMYFKSGDRDMYSEAFGKSGNRYCYIFDTGKTVRFVAG